MFKRLLPWLALIAGIIPFLGCATVMKGGEQQVSFRSDPSNASVSVYDGNGRLIANGRTPITLPLAKGASYFQAAKYRVVFESPGRSTKEMWLSGSLETGWYIAGNFLVGGFIGWLIVDPLTGAMWTLKPSEIDAKLDPSMSMSDGSIQVVLAETMSPDLLALATPLGSMNQ